MPYGFEKLMKQKLSEMGKMETNAIQQCVDELIKLGAKHKHIKIHRAKDTTSTDIYDEKSMIGYTIKRIVEGTTMRITADPADFRPKEEKARAA